MTTPYYRIGRNAHRLPAGYFADCQLSAAPENLERSEQSGAESREVSGGSGAAVHSHARQPAASGHHSQHGITGASPELAKPAPADDAVTGGRGLFSTAAHIARHAAGVWHQAYGVAAERIKHGQQLRAARTISGRVTG